LYKTEFIEQVQERQQILCVFHVRKVLIAAEEANWVVGSGQHEALKSKSA